MICWNKYTRGLGWKVDAGAKLGVIVVGPVGNLHNNRVRELMETLPLSGHVLLHSVVTLYCERNNSQDLMSFGRFPPKPL